MNIIMDSWLPATQDGRPVKASLAAVLSGEAQLDIVRPDLDGAFLIFMVALLQAIKLPASEEEWLEVYRNPPGRAEFETLFAPYADTFDMCHPEHPAFQDRTVLDALAAAAKPGKRGEDADEDDTLVNPVGVLSFSAPALNTLKNNNDLFVKRDEVSESMSLEGATLNLIALQVFAVGASKGNYSSTRGGSPLNTLLVGDTPFHTVWLNVLPAPDMERHAWMVHGPQDFPWMKTIPVHAAGDTSVVPVRPGDGRMAPVTQFLNCVRRISLRVQDGAGTNALCPVTRRPMTQKVTEYVRASYGPKFSGWTSTINPGETVLATPKVPRYERFMAARMGQDLGRQMLAVGLLKPPSKKVEPFEAEVVKVARTLRAAELGLGIVEVWMFGFQTDKAKVEGWAEYRMAIPSCQNAGAFTREMTVLFEALQRTEHALVPALMLMQAAFGKEVGKERFRGEWEMRSHKLQRLLYRRAADIAQAVDADVPMVPEDMITALLGGTDAFGEATDGIRKQWKSDLSFQARQCLDALTVDFDVAGHGQLYARAVDALGAFFSSDKNRLYEAKKEKDVKPEEDNEVEDVAAMEDAA